MRRRCEQGFTVFEMTVVLLVACALAVYASRAFDDLTLESKTAIENSLAIRVQAELNYYFIDPARGNKKTYPPVLDSAAAGPCTSLNPCFADILPDGGVMKEWSKLSPTIYRSAASGTNEWVYSPAAGSFTKVAE